MAFIRPPDGRTFPAQCTGFVPNDSEQETFEQFLSAQGTGSYPPLQNG